MQPYKGYRSRLALFLSLTLAPIIIVFLITYNLLANGMIKQIRDKEEKSLSEYSKRTNLVLEDINRSSIQLASSFISYKSSYSELINTPIIELNHILQNNSTILTHNVFIKSIYVYYNDDQTFIVNGQFCDLESFADKGWLEDYNNFVKKQGKESVVWFYNRPYIDGAWNLGNGCTIIQPFPLVGNPKVGYIVMNVDMEKQIKDILSINTISQNKYFVFSDKQVLYSSYSNKNEIKNIDLDKRTVKINGEKNIIFSYVSQINKLRYVCLINEKELLKPLQPLKYMLYTILIIICLIVLLISLKVSQLLYKPIGELVDFVKKSISISTNYDEVNDKNENEFSFIKEKFIKNINANQLMLSELNLNKSMTREVRIRRLLRKELEFNDNNELTKIFEGTSNEFLVVTFENYVKEDYLGSSNNFSWAVKEIVKSKLYTEYKYVETKMDKYMVCFIIYFKEIGSYEKTKVDIEKKLVNAFEDLKHKGIEYFSVGVGTVETKIENVNNSYLNSLSATNYRIYTKDIPLVFFENIPKYDINKSSGYPVELEMKLIAAIKERKNVDVVKYINQITELIEKNNVPPDYAYSRLHSIRDIIFDIPGSLGYKPEEIFLTDHVKLFQEFKYKRNIYEINDYFIELAVKIIGGLNSKSINKNSELIEGIKKYTVNHIGEDISLSSIADAFEISAPYLSTIFKQETGENYLKYVVALKMEFSEKLIKETNMTIKDISEKIGYLNERSFHNTFKKHFGQTPAEYRKIHKRETI